MPWQHLWVLLHEAVPWSVDALSGPAVCGWFWVGGHNDACGNMLWGLR